MLPRFDIGNDLLLGMRHGRQHRFCERAGGWPVRRSGVSVPHRRGETSHALPSASLLRPRALVAMIADTFGFVINDGLELS